MPVWWPQFLDARWVITTVMGLLGIGSLVLGFAADPDASSIPGPAAALGVATGFAIVAYVDYRENRQRRSLIRALAMPAAGLTFLLVVGAVATALNPTVSAQAAFRDAAPALVGIGFALMLLAATLSERDPRKARRAAIATTGIGAIGIGVIAVTSGDAWRPIGALLVMVGFLIVIASYVYDRFLADPSSVDQRS